MSNLFVKIMMITTLCAILQNCKDDAPELEFLGHAQYGCAGTIYKIGKDTKWLLVIRPIPASLDNKSFNLAEDSTQLDVILFEYDKSTVNYCPCSYTGNNYDGKVLRVYEAKSGIIKFDVDNNSIKHNSGLDGFPPFVSFNVNIFLENILFGDNGETLIIKKLEFKNVSCDSINAGNGC